MAKEIYLPLKVAQAYGPTGLREVLLSFGAPEDAAYQDYLDLANDKDFYTPRYNGPMKTLNLNIIRAAGSTMSLFSGETPQAAWKDILSMYGVVGKWKQNKQVYQFDRDFALELSRSESLKLYPELLRRLPYRNFYVDISNIDEFKPFDGMFVDVEVFPDDSLLVIGHRVVGETYYTWTNGFEVTAAMEENGYRYYDLSKVVTDFPKTLPLSEPDKKRLGDTIINQENFLDIRMFLFQALTYLSSEKPDISENEHTKRTYRPGKVVKDKFSEIRKWDVGSTYGNVFRKQKAERSEKEAEPSDAEGATRKSPRPHPRCAHWHHYWTGQGRTELTVKWIQPTFVGARADGTVRITQVKEEKDH